MDSYNIRLFNSILILGLIINKYYIRILCSTNIYSLLLLFIMLYILIIVLVLCDY